MMKLEKHPKNNMKKGYVEKNNPNLKQGNIVIDLEIDKDLRTGARISKDAVKNSPP